MASRAGLRITGCGNCTPHHESAVRAMQERSAQIGLDTALKKTPERGAHPARASSAWGSKLKTKAPRSGA
jgi:hypothetical protein